MFYLIYFPFWRKKSYSTVRDTPRKLIFRAKCLVVCACYTLYRARRVIFFPVCNIHVMIGSSRWILSPQNYPRKKQISTTKLLVSYQFLIGWLEFGEPMQRGVCKFLGGNICKFLLPHRGWYFTLAYRYPLARGAGTGNAPYAKYGMYVFGPSLHTP